MAHIKARKPCTILKHTRHACHLAGVQVVDARDGFKFLHMAKPKAGGRWAGIGERGVKDHLGHRSVGLVGFPAGSHDVRVQAVGRARATVAQIVVVERQRRVLRRIASVSLLGVGAKGTHQGCHHDGHPSEYSFWFHKLIFLVVVIN